ncbi:uncharacterized protein TRUGW13939_10213 [Talaromyces rugulosus]|uniref:Zn(2)-C6 fungal-type domain-containing protein n=1 Tax=Talaromyces rugulosus TaxID=121627 RepID=A0A7H8RC36_TALRU|nr:uncharacterized protein TRUGW13939_10213 [Talaromyces rugulosus]QKX63045.1 hypothetical protein TRUGW13939_10213 [Talaromyces rugulosus]
MPNVGRPSRDCHKCRKLRTKCDLGRPECRQCQRRGSPCPGYRDDNEILFHVESVASYQSNMSGDRRRSRRKHEKQPSPPRTMPQSSFIISSITEDIDLVFSWKEVLDHVNVSIRTAQRLYLSRSWSDYILPLTIYKFSFGIANGQLQGLPDFISSLVDRVEEGSALSLAYRAAGSAYLAKNLDQDMSKAIHDYNNALSVIQNELEDSEKTDGTVLAVWLLVVYELMLSTRNDTPHSVASSGWELHSQGLVALVRVRGPQQFSRQDGRNIFWVIFTTIQLQASITGKECPEDSRRWLDEIAQHCSSLWEQALLQMFRYSLYCTNMCSRIRQLETSGNVENILSSVPHILGDMEIMDKLYEDSHSARMALDDQNKAAVLNNSRVYIKNYQDSFRIRLLTNVLEFLLHACQSPSCAPPQRGALSQHRWRCVDELKTLIDGITLFLSNDSDK